MFETFKGKFDKLSLFDMTANDGYIYLKTDKNLRPNKES